ncbi:MAG TPA: hypothetical protein VFA26_20345 [Gemmataceae bacterium]|nr:hypothetical protein [Gemmataceae bacterium]
MHVVCPHCRNPIDLAENLPAGEPLCPSCGSSFRLDRGATTAPDAGGLRPLGRFTLLELLGQGAFGTVYTRNA